MRINYTMVGNSLTGGTRVIFEIAKRLLKRGHKVTITAVGKPYDAAWIDIPAQFIYVNDDHREPKWLQFLRRRTDIDLWPDRLIRRLAMATPECDINVGTFCFTALAVFRSGKGIPFYHMQHDETLFYRDMYRQRLALESYYLPLHKIANCTWLKALFEKKGLPVAHETVIVPPAIDHEFFNTSYQRTARSDGKRSVVALGKDVDWKGLRDLFKAMQIVYHKNPKVKLILFGCNSINFNNEGVPYECVGIKKDQELAQLYTDADIVVTPSWYESFPLPPLEAMACGTPVVTTRYGTEDYAINEKNCLVVEPKNHVQLANAILKLLDSNSLRERFRANGPETAQKFTWDKTTDLVEKIFQETLNNYTKNKL